MVHLVQVAQVEVVARILVAEHSDCGRRRAGDRVEAWEGGHAAARAIIVEELQVLDFDLVDVADREHRTHHGEVDVDHGEIVPYLRHQVTAAVTLKAGAGDLGGEEHGSEHNVPPVGRRQSDAGDFQQAVNVGQSNDVALGA